ncbi:PE family protein [Mycobacterium sp. TY815]|nr:PE family protein [Mycobacterium sp. TY815]MDP7701606.1 PE family protein [Mycobacterium sp. TY815]
MSQLWAVPELLTSTATDLAGIGSALDRRGRNLCRDHVGVQSERPGG